MIVCKFQGAISGFFVSLSVILWLSIGGMMYANPTPKKPPGPVYACPAQNVTSVLASTSASVYLDSSVQENVEYAYTTLIPAVEENKTLNNTLTG